MRLFYFKNDQGVNVRGIVAMRSIAFADFLIGIGILLVLEGIIFLAVPNWMRRAMKSALATPDTILRMTGLASALIGLAMIWAIR